MGRPGALENQERWRTRSSREPGALEDQALWRTRSAGGPGALENQPADSEWPAGPGTDGTGTTGDRVRTFFHTVLQTRDRHYV